MFNNRNAEEFNAIMLSDLIVYQPSNISNVDFDPSTISKTLWSIQQHIKLLRIDQATKIVAPCKRWILSKPAISWTKTNCCFFKLVKANNQLLLLDEPLSHVDFETKKLVLENLLPIICKNNLVIYVSHDLSLQDYFLRIIDLSVK